MLTNFLKRRRLRKIMADIEITLLTTFERLKTTAINSDSPLREFEMGAALAALIGGLRDAYPNIPIEDQSIAVALIEANAGSMMTETVVIADAVSKLVLECPDKSGEKIDTTYFMIAPVSARHAKGFTL